MDCTGCIHKKICELWGKAEGQDASCYDDSCKETLADILGDDYDLDRLHELVKADRDKRCVIFKFGLGSAVYRVWVRPDGSHPFVSAENMSTVNDLVNAESWTDSYASREAAEAEVAALKRRFADGQGTQKR